MCFPGRVERSLYLSLRKRWLRGNKRARSYPESSKLIFAVLHKPWGSVFGQAGSACEEDPSPAVAPSTVFKDSLRVTASHPGVGQEGYSLVSRSAHWRRHQLHKAMQDAQLISWQLHKRGPTFTVLCKHTCVTHGSLADTVEVVSHALSWSHLGNVDSVNLGVGVALFEGDEARTCNGELSSSSINIAWLTVSDCDSVSYGQMGLGK